MEKSPTSRISSHCQSPRFPPWPLAPVSSSMDMVVQPCHQSTLQTSGQHLASLPSPRSRSPRFLPQIFLPQPLPPTSTSYPSSYYHTITLLPPPHWLLLHIHYTSSSLPTTSLGLSLTSSIRFLHITCHLSTHSPTHHIWLTLHCQRRLLPSRILSRVCRLAHRH